jgi:CheY-like chemotaxis protein
MDTPAPQPPLTIFIVDDNPVDVYLIRWVLDAHELPYELHVIDNGNHALQVFDQLAEQENRRSPTLVLLDFNQPQRDGKGLLRHIKAIPHGADIRVVIVTSSADPREWAETLALEATLGDSVGYAFGKRVGPSLFSREDSWFFTTHHLEKAHQFYERHGGKIIVLARFVRFVRTRLP